MSAFQVAFEHLRYLADDVVADEILTNLLDEHAHELAEEIRHLGDIWGSLDVLDAADAIDPKVKK